MLYSALVKPGFVVQHQNRIVSREAEMVEPLQFSAVLRDRKQCELVGDEQEGRLTDPALKIAQEAHEAGTMQGVCEDRMGVA